MRKEANNGNQNGNRERTFTMRDLFAMCFRHRRLLTYCGIGIVLGTVLFALLLPTYQAETKILIERERVDPVVTPQPDQTNQQVAALNITQQELNSEVELLDSEDLLRKVVLKCDLQHPKTPVGKMVALATQWWMSDDEKLEGATRKLASDLNIEQLSQTNVIRVQYPARDPNLASQVLSTLNAVYREKHVAAHRASGQFDFFKDETDQYRKGLMLAEDRLTNFPREQGVANPQLLRDITLQKYGEFNANLAQTRVDIRTTEQRVHALEQEAGITPSRLTTQIHQADDGPVMQELKTNLLNLEMQRIDLLTKFQPDYRPVQEIEKQIAETRASIASEEKIPLRDETTDQNPTYAWLISELAKEKADLSGLQARAAATEKVVGQYAASANELQEKGIALQDLMREANVQERSYLLYTQKREEARITEALDRSTQILNVAVVEDPVVPALPYHSPMVFGLLGFLLFTTVSAGLVFGLEYFDPSFRTPDEVQENLNLPVLAAIPRNGHGVEHRV